MSDITMIDINQEWLSRSTDYTPAFDNAKEILNALKDFESTTLSDETAICLLSKELTKDGSSESTLSCDILPKALEHVDTGHHVLLINRFLVLSKRELIPPDSSMLRISSQAFRILSSSLHLPVSFIYALSRYHLPNGRGFFTRGTDDGEYKLHEMWYILPLRVQYKCNDKAKEHEGSTTGSNQMNPFHYLLHLSDIGIDIRGSRIAVFSRYSADGKSMVTVAVSFMDGRWSRAALEPKKRIKETWDVNTGSDLQNRPFDVHCIYFTSALRWWTNALGSVNEQLMVYERRLQEAIDNDSQANALGILNRALHAVAAHLQRYNTELESVQETWHDIIRQHRAYCERKNSRRHTEDNPDDTSSEGLEQIESHLKQIKAFLLELVAKVQNNLALLFNCIQITNDRRMVVNGEKMNAILIATQDEAKRSKQIAEYSIKLSEEMKQDSVAMKTIAITTMFFLPGTSFASFLSMPFFTQALSDSPRTCWIWLVCTIPSTIAAFAFYIYWRHREQARKSHIGATEQHSSLARSHCHSI
ncbi:hypothetical protein V8E51_006177 [Hyaloscypha variabilis]